jgi:type VI secretion system protein ImpM
MAAWRGFFGKIPARGDFVRAALPRSFIDAWDVWLQRVLAGSQELLGEAWLPAWMEAPIWRFALPAGQCGPDAVLGLWMPSVDRAGRLFPLSIVALAESSTNNLSALLREGGPWLDAVEQAGLDALEHNLSPEALAERVADPAHWQQIGPSAADPYLAGTGALWWTAGSPHVASGYHALGALPNAAQFARMLDESSSETTGQYPPATSGSP